MRDTQDFFIFNNDYKKYVPSAWNEILDKFATIKK